MDDIVNIYKLKPGIVPEDVSNTAFNNGFIEGVKLYQKLLTNNLDELSLQGKDEVINRDELKAAFDRIIDCFNKSL